MLTQLGRGISTSNPSNAVISPIIDTTPKTVALFGDSFIEQHTQNTTNNKLFENVGWFNVVNFKMNNRFNFDLNLNFGASGNTAVQMAARKTDMFGSNADIYFVMGGTNDISNQSAPATIQSALSEIYDYIRNTLGGQVYALTILPRSYWPPSFDAGEIAQAKADIITVNNWIKSQPNITVIDSYALWDDGNDGPITGYTSDGLHCAPIGANAIADGIINVMRPRFGDASSLDLTENLFTNGNFSGTGASLPSGCSGVLPSPLKAQTIGGTADNNWRVFSKTAEDYLQIDISVPQGNGTVGVIVRQKIEVGTDYDLLSNLDAACEMEVVSVSGDPKLAAFEIRHEGGPNGNVYYGGMDDDQLNIPAYGAGICAVPEINPIDSTILRGRIVIEGDTTNAPLNMTVILKGMFITQQ